MKMNLNRANELIEPLRKGTAIGISNHWKARLIEALEYVIENESQPVKRVADNGDAMYCRCSKPKYNVLNMCLVCGYPRW